MEALNELTVADVPNVQIGDHLSKMTNLRTISFTNCSLTTFPDVSHLALSSLSLEENYLTHLSGPVDAYMLIIDDNLFESFPILKNPDKIIFLSASNNPISSITPVLAYKNLTVLSVANTDVTFIPPTIDHLQELKMIDLSGTKITRLPTNILNLPKLEYLNIQDTLLSAMQIQSIAKAFKIARPNLTLDV